MTPPGSSRPRPSAPPGSSSQRHGPRRPDPTAARLAVAAGGIATMSALVAAIAGGALPARTVVPSQPAAGAAASSTVATVRYVYIQSGQAAPAAVATPLVTPAPVQVQAPVVTHQSGAKP